MRRPSLPLRGLVRIAGFLASEEELGDVMEEYAARRQGAVWVCRQLITATGRRRSRGATTIDGSPAMLSPIGTDVSYAIRTLRRYPGFALAAITPIALGIGINTGLFSMLDVLVLQPVASPRPAELISIYQDFLGVKKRHVHGARSMFSLPEVEHYRAADRTLTGVMAYSMHVTATLAGDAPRQVNGALVTCNYFDVLEVRPSLGTGFTDVNCERSTDVPSVVLTHELWTQLHGQNRDITGATVVLNGRIFAVAGVAPPGLAGIDFARVSFFVPVSAQPLLEPAEDYVRDAGTSWLTMVARRRPEVTLNAARAELAQVARQIDLQQPGRTTTLIVEPARTLSNPHDRREVFSIAAIMLAAFGLILLIACANVANLLLARGAARGKEIALRLSLGITRRRLVQQLMTESMIIALLGAVAGTILAQWSLASVFPILRSAFPAQMVALGDAPGVNAHVLSFALIVTVVTALVFGLLPALHASRLDLQTLLSRDSAGAGRHRGGWLRGSLIGLQAGVCTTLLIGAALLLRTVYVTETVEPGFEYRNVAVVSFDPRGPGYDASRAAAFRRRLTDRLRSLPGIESVAEAGKTPLSPGRSETAVRRMDQPDWREIDFTGVSPEYFSVIGAPIVRGRTFSEAELEPGSQAVILSESTARRYFPGDNPIGQRLLTPLGAEAEATLEVVGVAKDVQVVRIGEAETSYMYRPVDRSSLQPLALLVRSRAPLAALAPEIRDAAREIEPALVVGVSPLEGNLRFWRSVSRVTAAVSGSVSALAMCLASIGIYGVVSYVVSRRVREIGIRMMLGATATDVRRMVVAETLRPVAIGTILGIAGAVGAAQVLRSVLFGVSPLDPAAFIAAPLLLLAVAAAASVAPTWRALNLDPMSSLRRE